MALMLLLCQCLNNNKSARRGTEKVAINIAISYEKYNGKWGLLLTAVTRALEELSELYAQ